MRQVGRSVQCRQNRRGRTAATWPCLIPSAYSWDASLPVEGSKMLTIIQAQTPKHIQQFQELVAEYKAWDIEMSSKMGLSANILLEFGYQGRANDHLAEFAPPNGRLLLASLDGQVVGCAGLRPLSPGRGVLLAWRRRRAWVSAERGSAGPGQPTA